MRCDHEHDDGAYVLGALSPAERAAYERHLATCSFCREAVADIAALPGLLGRLDPAEFAKLVDPSLSAPPASRNRTPDLVVAAQSRRRRERRSARVRVLSTAVAAAIVALIVGAGAVFWSGPRTQEAAAVDGTVAMVPTDADVPVSARVSLNGLSGGTKVSLTCRYQKDSDGQKPLRVQLRGYGTDGEVDAMGSWTAAPGRDFTMSGVTHLVGGNLARLAIVGESGQTLLSVDVP